MARQLLPQGMNRVDESQPNSRGTSDAPPLAPDAFAHNCFVLSLAAMHEDAHSGLPALQSEAARWRRLHHRLRGNLEPGLATDCSRARSAEVAQCQCRFLLRAGHYRVGRARDNDLRLDCPGISRRHAEIIVLSTRGAIVRDLGSANGTRVDGFPIIEAAVDGAVVLDLGPLRLNLGPGRQLDT